MRKKPPYRLERFPVSYFSTGTGSSDPVRIAARPRSVFWAYEVRLALKGVFAPCRRIDELFSWVSYRSSLPAPTIA